MFSRSRLEPSDTILINPVEEQDQAEMANLSVNPFRIRKMYLAALASLLYAIVMGLGVGYTAPATYDLMHGHMKANKDQISWIGSILALGAMVGGLFGGPLADRVGRKCCLVLNVIPFMAGWLAIAFASTINTIVFARFLCGVACGMVSVTVPMYCVEISTPEVRGLLGSSFQGFMVLGNLLAAVIGDYVTWKTLALVGAGTSALALVCFVRMPESPRWLMAQGEMRCALDVMYDLQGRHPSVRTEYDRIYEDLSFQPKGSLTMKEFKDPSIYKPTLIIVALMFFQQFSGANAVLFYSSTIFDGSKELMDPKKATIILGAIQVAATLLSNVMVDKAGRKSLLIISGALMSLSHVILGVYYFESTDSGTFKIKFDWIPLTSLCTFIIAFSLGFGPIPWLSASEMVPMRARSTVSGIGTFSNGLFAFFITKTFTELEDVTSVQGAFWTYGIVTLASCFFVVFVMPETKGKQLEEITNHFCKFRKEISVSVIS